MIIQYLKNIFKAKEIAPKVEYTIKNRYNTGSSVTENFLLEDYPKYVGTDIDKLKALKVKIKSLAEESKIIKKEIKKSNIPTKDYLQLHRKFVVRPETRSALLAYRFLKGHSYLSTEIASLSEPDSERVARLVNKYGSQINNITPYDIENWAEKRK